jgi:hypothetical protein
MRGYIHRGMTEASRYDLSFNHSVRVLFRLSAALHR